MAGTIRIEDPDDNIPLFGPDPDDEPLFGPTTPHNPAPPVPPPVVMMVPLTIVSDASIVAPPPVAPPPFDVPALGSPVPAVVDEMVEESQGEENVYAHIDARAIDVELDMPSANPNIMNVTSHRQDKYANLSC